MEEASPLNLEDVAIFAELLELLGAAEDEPLEVAVVRVLEADHAEAAAHGPVRHRTAAALVAESLRGLGDCAQPDYLPRVRAAHELLRSSTGHGARRG